MHRKAQVISLTGLANEPPVLLIIVQCAKGVEMAAIRVDYPLGLNK